MRVPVSFSDTSFADKRMTYFTQRTRSPKTIFLQIFLVVAFSAIVALGVNSARRDGIPLVEDWNQKAAARDVAPGLQAVSLDEVRERMEDGSAVIVDARDEDFYRLGHIPGSINLPVHDFDRVYAEVSPSLPLDQPIIVYCEGFGCEMSDQLAEKLLSIGYGRILVYTGGMEEWTAKGMPLETGPKS